MGDQGGNANDTARILHHHCRHRGRKHENRSDGHVDKSGALQGHRRARFFPGDLTVADEVCAEKLIEHEYLSKTDIPGPQILKAQIEDARRSIKDLKLSIEAVVETGDTVWARSKATGVDPRSGKQVTIDVMDICRFAGGKLVEHWGVPDRFALLHQIGALPPPPK